MENPEILFRVLNSWLRYFKELLFTGACSFWEGIKENLWLQGNITKLVFHPTEFCRISEHFPRVVAYNSCPLFINYNLRINRY